MPKKQSRIIIYLACLKSELEKMKRFLDDDEPVYLTFLETTNYREKADKVMLKTAIEKPN